MVHLYPVYDRSRAGISKAEQACAGCLLFYGLSIIDTAVGLFQTTVCSHRNSGSSFCLKADLCPEALAMECAVRPDLSAAYTFIAYQYGQAGF